MSKRDFYKLWKEEKAFAQRNWENYAALRDRRRVELWAAIFFFVVAVIGWAL